MSKSLKYKYKYSNLDELIDKMESLESMLSDYRRTTNPNITWETQVIITQKNEYVYKVQVFERLDRHSGETL